jgi:hypothetical protein
MPVARSLCIENVPTLLLMMLIQVSHGFVRRAKRLGHLGNRRTLFWMYKLLSTLVSLKLKIAPVLNVTVCQLIGL